MYSKQILIFFVFVLIKHICSVKKVIEIWSLPYFSVAAIKLERNKIKQFSRKDDSSSSLKIQGRAGKIVG